jgi:hypothetical protein
MTYNDPAHRPAQPGPVPAPPPQWAPPQQYGYPAPYQQQPPGTNGLGVAGFVCGLIGLIFCWDRAGDHRDRRPRVGQLTPDPRGWDGWDDQS